MTSCHLPLTMWEAVGRYIIMKYIVVFVIGAVVGGFGMSYHYDREVRSATNAHIDSAVAQGAQQAHTAIQKANQ